MTVVAVQALISVSVYTNVQYTNVQTSTASHNLEQILMSSKYELRELLTPPLSWRSSKMR